MDTIMIDVTCCRKQPRHDVETCSKTSLCCFKIHEKDKQCYKDAACEDELRQVLKNCPAQDPGFWLSTEPRDLSFLVDLSYDGISNLLWPIEHAIKLARDTKFTQIADGLSDLDMKLLNKLCEWIKELDIPRSKYDLTYRLRSGSPEVHLYLYSDTTAYSIAMYPRYPKSYLGCIANSRKQRAGEDWTRGSDLPDGPVDRETWDAIIKAIFKYELVDVKHRKHEVRGVLAGEHPMGPSLDAQGQPEKEIVLPAGTLIKIEGIPFRLSYETVVDGCAENLKLTSVGK